MPTKCRFACSPSAMALAERASRRPCRAVGAPLDLLRPSGQSLRRLLHRLARHELHSPPHRGHFRSTSGLTLPLPEGIHPAHASGGDLVYGIRPEHIRSTAQGIPAKVTLLEATGSEIFAKVDCGHEEISFLLPERLAPKQGEQVRIEIDRACAHLFDATTGRRL